MQLFQPFLFSLSLACLALLGACGSSQTKSSTPVSTATKTIETPIAKTSSSPSMAKSATQNNTANQGGQVIESGIYHLEFLSLIEADSIHLDFFLQKGDNHEAIPDAKVTAQVQLPDGTQKTLDLKYDADGKHYAVVFPSKATGEYKVAFLSDIKGEKVNGRFSFNR
ncbi:hypothetical protein H6F42_21140 [Pseudanabaena sp. FACHB-1998]|uniref:hypothetical protein n=1 Tax=Pseudanabaena sp. FACHB-1998 TaxID=2692858 RepID=UPI00168071E8|nr:hypothetical protein [Pseudanabaena sp. FACHB-1998]MBD2179424.1 hypothetical protein [Pseudanabaena sp. FACHB-1998]